jgi:drug/metabolite transporter (DMT)-like permease
MTRILIILVLALVVEAVGVVFLSKGLKEIGEVRKVNIREIAGVIRRGAVNPSLLLGVAMEAAFFAALLYLLSQKDVSLIWPLTSLGFVLTALSAKLILHEVVSPMRWAGVILIVIGAGLVSVSEKAPERASASPSPPSAQP